MTKVTRMRLIVLINASEFILHAAYVFPFTALPIHRSLNRSFFLQQYGESASIPPF